MKKIFRTLLALGMSTAMVTSIAGCSGGTKSEAPAEAPAEVTTVTVWTGNGHDKAFLNEEIAKWNDTIGKEKGIKIEYTVQDGNISEKIDLAFTSGQAPDLFGGGSISKLSENGQIIALDDIEGGAELIEKYKDDIMVGRHKYMGKVYTLPRTVNTYGLVYNKEMFRNAGLVDENGEPTPPKTLKEFREYAKKLTNPEKKEYGIIFPGKYGSWYSDDVMKMASASCGMVDGYDFKTGTFDFSKQEEIMQTIMGIKEDGSYMPGVESLTNDAARAKFGAGGIGMKVAGSFDYGVLTEQFPAQIEWGVAPYPVVDENDTYLQYMNNGGYLQINAQSVEKIGAEKLMEVYKWFYSDELLTASYKRGIDIPINWEIVEDIKLDEKLENWREFGKLVSISASYPAAMPTQLDGQEKIAQIWLNKIWPGTVAPDGIADALKEYGDKMNKGIETYLSTHPNFDKTQYINTELNTKR